VTAYYEFRLISAIVGLFSKVKACQFHALQHVLNQVRLVRDPLSQMRSAEELLEFRAQSNGAFDFDLRCRPVTASIVKPGCNSPLVRRGPSVSA
jgi:hypothetical protein